MRAIIVGLGLLVAGCGQDDQVKRRIAATFSDPEAVKFQHFNIANSLACGQVNAKNAVGGYVGYRIFDAPVSGDGVIQPYFGPDDELAGMDPKMRLQIDDDACIGARKFRKRMGDKSEPEQCSQRAQDEQTLAEAAAFKRDVKSCLGPAAAAELGL